MKASHYLPYEFERMDNGDGFEKDGKIDNIY